MSKENESNDTNEKIIYSDDLYILKKGEFSYKLYDIKKKETITTFSRIHCSDEKGHNVRVHIGWFESVIDHIIKENDEIKLLKEKVQAMENKLLILYDYFEAKMHFETEKNKQ